MKNVGIIIVVVVLLASLIVIENLVPKEPSENVTNDDAPVLRDDNSNEVVVSQPVQEETLGAQNILDLSGQGLSKVPDYIFNRTDVIDLNLSNNNLTGALQAEVRHLYNLESLDLSNNNFTGVPAEVGQLSKLRILNLSYNNLTGLPYELGNLSNLEVLDLRGNQYSELDLNIIKQKLPASLRILVD